MTLDEEDIVAVAAAVVRMLREAPPPRERPPQRLSKAELATALHRTPATIDRWVANGMPCDNMGSYKLFDLDACRRWRSSRTPVQRTKAAKQPSPTASHASLPNGVELRTRKAS